MNKLFFEKDLKHIEGKRIKSIKVYDEEGNSIDIPSGTDTKVYNGRLDHHSPGKFLSFDMDKNIYVLGE